jgi:hypothetical protein
MKKEEEVTALRRLNMDLERVFHKNVSEFFKSKKELQTALENIIEPLTQEPGCSACACALAESSTARLYNFALQREVELLTIHQEEEFIANERLRKRIAFLSAELETEKSKRIVHTEKDQIIEDQKRQMDEMRSQLEAYVVDRLSMTMEIHHLKTQIDELERRNVPSTHSKGGKTENGKKNPRESKPPAPASVQFPSEARSQEPESQAPTLRGYPSSVAFLGRSSLPTSENNRYVDVMDLGFGSLSEFQKWFDRTILIGIDREANMERERAQRAQSKDDLNP